MDLSWFEGMILGLLSGFADVLPVSAQAHRSIFLKIIGVDSQPALMALFVDLAILGALYVGCGNQLRRISRQLRLARIPKKKRQRPLDVRTLMEFRLLRVMLIPVILSVFLYQKTSAWSTRLNITALFLVVNAVILYLPNLLPSGNKDSRSMSGLEGLLMGLGGAASILPGVSSVGVSSSIASVCGAERSFGLNMVYLMQMAVVAVRIIFDFSVIFSTGLVFTLGILLTCVFAALAAFVGAFFGIRLMRTIAVNVGFSIFSYYCLGAALFAFILYLIV